LNEIWRAFIASKELSFDIRNKIIKYPFRGRGIEAQLKNLKWYKGSSDGIFEVSERTLG